VKKIRDRVALVLISLTAAAAEGEAELLGPLRIRDMTPFNILRLDMLPAHAVAAGPKSWGIEADLSYANTSCEARTSELPFQARFPRPADAGDVKREFSEWGGMPTSGRGVRPPGSHASLRDSRAAPPST